ncbi:hypothetical protein KIM372_01070 [Bombiscardovia nodaiensis]|uniref:Uncharacterized protein n=1 Tax=Bombiscardovia nodaiensis TaxID=2932181 RepID=A0ABN6S7K0_9BIFI|nr:hypothetical protein KIM372_01070 [Bombiscardovia nodaiensis]
MKKLHRPLPVKLLSLATALSLLLSLIIALTHPHLTSAVPTAAQTQSQPVPSPQDQSVNSTTNADGFTIQPNRGPARGGNDVTITPPKASSASCSCPEASRPLPIYQLDFGGVLIQPQDATIDPATLSWTVKAPQHAPAQVTVTAKYADQTWKTTPSPTPT